MMSVRAYVGAKPSKFKSLACGKIDSDMLSFEKTVSLKVDPLMQCGALFARCRMFFKASAIFAACLQVFKMGIKLADRKAVDFITGVSIHNGTANFKFAPR